MKVKRQVLLFLVTLLPLVACAYDAEIDGIYYNLWHGDQATVTYRNDSYNSYSGVIKIPSSVTYWGSTYKVVGITHYAFKDCTNLTSVTIPNSVTSIGSYAFQYCSSLTSITIPNSVTDIGWNAFENCSSLTSSITIPNGVTSILSEAFKGCSRLTTVSIPNSVASIGESAFYNCSGLTSITIPESVTSIGDRAFHGCVFVSSSFVNNSMLTSDNNWGATICDEETSDGLLIKDNSVVRCKLWATSVTIPDRVTCIGRSAFACCSGLTTITIPNSVTSIGDDAFYDCTSLASVTIPNSVTSIGNNAFFCCSGLTSVDILNGVSSIGERAFEGCKGLTSVTIPNSVTSIGEIAFGFCGSLTSVTIPNSVTTIGGSVFFGCTGLKSVTIGSSVTSIGSNAFFDCGNLTDVYCYAEQVPNTPGNIFPLVSSAVLHVPATSVEAYRATAPWSSFGSIVPLEENAGDDTYIDGIYYDFSDNEAKVIKSENSYSGDVVIPASVTYKGKTYNVTSIGENTFQGCSGLTSITIPESVRTIGNGAFSGCFNLTSIIIPKGVTSIGHMTFSECLKLTSVTIPDGVTTIGVWAFQGCSSLKSITIPNSVTSIGEMAFAQCFNLSTITIGKTVNTIGSQAFMKCSGLKDVYCYAEQVPNTPGNIFPLVSSAVLHVPTTSVEAYRATAPWSSFGSIVPLEEETEDDTYIDGIYYDFSDNEAKVIKGENAYSGDVVIPSSVIYKGKSYNVSSIGDLAFFQCNGLTSVSIPESITNIGQLAFATCAGLTSITIPNSIISIGVGAFAECTGLTSISIPESMTAISESLLSGCSNLTSVIIPKGVTNIGEEAFAYCSKLKNVYCYAEQVPNTADNAFGNTPIQSAVLQVPTSSAKELYKTTAPWSGFGSIIAQTDEEIAGDGPQLENSSFDDWHVVGSGTQALYNPWKEGSVSFWDTGNRGATTVGASNSTYGTEDGRTYANLQSKFIVIKFAAGNIFTGSYLKTDGTNGILSLGRPFNSYPAKLQFDYTYKSSIVNKGGGKWDEKYSRYISQQTYDEMRGKPDSCCIWIALIGDKDEEEYEGVTYPFIIRTRPSTLKLFDPNSDNVIAHGQFTSGDDQTDWTTKTITLDYRHPDEDPKYIIVVATSSKYGDYFIGGDQSLLKLDNLKLLYNDSIPTERQTFFAEQANGVRMEFKVISKENQTCQVGSGTRPCISTETSGGVDIPSEVEGYTVVAVSEKAFDDCSGLTSVTIPNGVASIGSSAFQGCRLRNVLLRSTTPASIDEDAFSKNIYNHTILYIPNGSWGEYVFNSNWYQFINIRETTIVEEQLSMQQTYTLMDANTFAYSVYDPVNDCIGTISSEGINEDNPNHCWQVIEAGENSYLYNLGAKKFVTSYENSLNLTSKPNTIEMGNGKNGITLGKQEGNQWAFVSNEHMNVEQSIVDSIIAMQGTSLSRKTGADIYDLQGRKLSIFQKGINIIRMSDGTTRKVMIK